MAHIFSIVPESENPENILEFHIERTDGKTIDFTIPRVEHWPYHLVQKDTEWINSEAGKAATFFEVAVKRVSLFDAAAAKLLDINKLTMAQVNRIAELITMQKGIDTPGESDSSSE